MMLQEKDTRLLTFLDTCRTFHPPRGFLRWRWNESIPFPALTVRGFAKAPSIGVPFSDSLPPPLSRALETQEWRWWFKWFRRHLKAPRA